MLFMAIASAPPEAIHPVQVEVDPVPMVPPQFPETAQFAILLSVPPEHCESPAVALAWATDDNVVGCTALPQDYWI